MRVGQLLRPQQNNRRSIAAQFLIPLIERAIVDTVFRYRLAANGQSVVE